MYMYIYRLYCCSLIECIRSRCLNHLVHSMKTFQIDGCFRLGTTPSTCLYIYTCSFFVIGLEMVQSHSLSVRHRHTHDSSTIKNTYVSVSLFFFHDTHIPYCPCERISKPVCRIYCNSFHIYVLTSQWHIYALIRYFIK